MPKTFSYNRIANFYETDAARIVHFSNFFRYVEEAELEFLSTISPVDCSGVVWMRSDFSCDFYKPIKFDQQFNVVLTVTSASENGITYGFCFYLENDVSAKGSYSVKSLCFSNKTQQFNEQKISQALIDALNG